MTQELEGSAPKPSKEQTAAEKPVPSPAVQGLVQGLAAQQEDISRKSVKKRMARLFAPRVDGSYLVPEELVKQYKDLSLREALVDDFIASGLVKDCPGEYCIIYSSHTPRMYVCSFSFDLC